jgi:hypothetical protein
VLSGKSAVGRRLRAGHSVDTQAVNRRDGHNVQAVNRPICPICLASESINL